MNYTGLAVFGALILIVGIIILTRMIRVIRGESKQVKRIRTTDLYGHIYPMLKKYGTEYVESVRIRRDGISIRMVIPLGKEIHYTFARHGLDQPEGETLYALAQAVSVDMEALRNTRRYLFRTHREANANGEEALWYEYLIRPHCKSEMLRANLKKKQKGEDVPDAIHTAEDDMI